jgi:predicted DNA-binding transcriptional regulator YafY
VRCYMVIVDKVIEQVTLPCDIIRERTITVRYKNYRGEITLRHIVPKELWWGKTEYHPQEQWLLRVWDCERAAYRDYALEDILEFVK